MDRKSEGLDMDTGRNLSRDKTKQLRSYNAWYQKRKATSVNFLPIVLSKLGHKSHRQKTLTIIWIWIARCILERKMTFFQGSRLLMATEIPKSVWGEANTNSSHFSASCRRLPLGRLCAHWESTNVSDNWWKRSLALRGRENSPTTRLWKPIFWCHRYSYNFYLTLYPYGFASAFGT